jgi:hypothetical protein
MNATTFQKGDRVVFLADNDEGEVTGMTADREAVAIRWDSTGRIEWYSLCGGAIHLIEVLGEGEGE